jgi:hypothetical protein
MFGMWDAIYAFLSRMVGNRTDAADPNGSLHAKLADAKNAINNSINTTVQKPRSAQPVGSLSINTVNSWVTAVNITGRGSLKYCDFSPAGSSAFSYIRITIDGTQFVYFGNGSGGMYYLGNGGFTTNFVGSVDIPFKSSLKIEIMIGNGGSGTCKTNWQYNLE